MARSRSIPTNLFDDPDFFERSPQAQLIFIGLILDADDYGRGLAHSGLLARKLNQEVAHIDLALDELQKVGLLRCYRGERYRYYTLTRWQEWQTLHKPTPSRFPTPPPVALRSSENFFPEFSEISPENSGKGAPEEEGEEEQEENQKREGEEETGRRQYDATTSTHLRHTLSQTQEPDPPKSLQATSRSMHKEQTSSSSHHVSVRSGPKAESSEACRAGGEPGHDRCQRADQVGRGGERGPGADGGAPPPGHGARRHGHDAEVDGHQERGG